MGKNWVEILNQHTYTLIGLATNLHLVGQNWVEISSQVTKISSAVTNLHSMGKKWVETINSADINIH